MDSSIIKKKKPCILLGRFMPMHKGHQALIKQIEDLELIPILVLGEALESDSRNPWDYHTGHCMIKNVYPDIPMAKLLDAESWDEWGNNLKKIIALIEPIYGTPKIGIHDKDEDKQTFTFNGKEYKNKNYSAIFKELGIETISLNPTGIKVRATSIRKDLESNKEFLDEKIYKYIKENT